MKSFYVLAAGAATAIMSMVSCESPSEKKPEETVKSAPAKDEPVQVMANQIKLLRLYFPVASLGSDRAVVMLQTLRQDSLMGGIYGFSFGGSSAPRRLSFSSVATCKADSTILSSLPDTVLFSPLLISKPFVREIRKAANGYKTVLLQPEVVAGAIVWTIYATKLEFPLRQEDLAVLSKVRIGTANPCPPGNVED